jgi:hypothetical protein
LTILPSIYAHLQVVAIQASPAESRPDPDEHDAVPKKLPIHKFETLHVHGRL